MNVSYLENLKRCSAVGKQVIRASQAKKTLVVSSSPIRVLRISPNLQVLFGRVRFHKRVNS